MILSAKKGLLRLWLRLQEKLEKHKEIDLMEIVKEKLLKVSASTIDRLLKPLKDTLK